MNLFAKITIGAGAAALAALTAAPAQAQYYPYPQNNGVDVNEIVRGVAVAGAAAAAVGAITNAVRGGIYGNGGYGYPQGSYPQGTYGYPQGAYGYPQGTYGYPQGGGYAYPQGNAYGYGGVNIERAAVDACAAQAQRYGRVSSIDQVTRQNSRTLRVRGMIEANRGYTNASYGNYGVERRTFSCSFRNDGRITDFDTDKIRY